MSERFDAVVIGLGPGGEVAAGRLLASGRRVAVIERELIGGECAYWACIPSKTLLRPPEARAEAGRAPGTGRPDIDWPALRDYRDYMIRHLDDTAQVDGYQQQGATVIKGEGRLAGPGRVEVDGQVLEGDVTGVALFTHVAKYQARVVVDNICGRPRQARYQGIPRVIFADPEIAAVGLTTRGASEAGINLVSAEMDLADSIARPWTYQKDPSGTLGILTDADQGVVVGAWAVAPLAGEWIHQAALAIRAAIPLDTLLDQVAQFPTYSEAYLQALEALAPTK
jgi:pyruvate/2-oxoglutarate dehydrogenase complex dihydrolipoamide dehydrogenase (E3) component